MKKSIIAFILGFVVSAVLSGLIIVHATTPSDDTLLSSIKQAFVAAGWTPPSTTPPPVPNPTPQPVTKPSELVGRLWTVMAPFNKVGETNSPENMYISKAEADSRYASVMFVRDGAVVFKTPAGGVHSENSKFPRSELREMKDENGTEAKWSNSSGTHTLTGRYSVQSTLVKRPQICLAQIHDSSDDVIQVAYDAGRIVLFWNDKNSVSVLDPAYTLGTQFDLKIVATGKKINVQYNNGAIASVSKSGSSYYFKTGSYIQSNVADYQEAPDAYGEVTIYSLSVTHQ